ncbi:papain fold toxin domain-containing protein [Terrimonas ginsenosidimutans]
MSENGIHRGVLVEGKVFDNLNSHGMDYKEWIKDFHAARDLKIIKITIQ